VLFLIAAGGADVKSNDPITERVPTPQGTVITDTIYGCSDLKVHDRILSMLKSGDKAPADKLFFRSDCTTFRKGERVRVEEWKVWGPKCVARLGHDENCYWLQSDAILR
jgi:hypothetical protein